MVDTQIQLRKGFIAVNQTYFDCAENYAMLFLHLIFIKVKSIATKLATLNCHNKQLMLLSSTPLPLLLYPLPHIPHSLQPLSLHLNSFSYSSSPKN